MVTPTMESMAVKFLIVLETNSVPLLDKMTSGKPILQKSPSIASATASDVTYFKGTASAQLEHVVII